MKLRFCVKGMTCAACSSRVEKVINSVPGVDKADVNLLAGTVDVLAADLSVTDKIIDAVRSAGYDAAVQGDKATKSEIPNVEQKQMKVRIIVSTVFLLILMYFTMGHMIGLPLPSWYCGPENVALAALLQFFLTIPVVYLNRIYYTRGFKALWHRSPNMDSLIAVGSGAALLYGITSLFRIVFAAGHGDLNSATSLGEDLYFESAAMILTLITLGKFLESRAKGKTGEAIRKLMDLSPKSAIVKIGALEKSVPIDELKVGDVVVVRSGALIPADGTIIEGRAAVDQSALTGESVPVELEVGSTVAAGTINREGFLQIRVDKVGDDTVLSQVIKMVEDASGSKAPIARLADKIAGIFVPVVMGISLCTLIIWLLLGNTFEFSLTNAVAVLVISCPCALGLATPVAIMVGTGRGAQMGVLYKTAESLENLHHVQIVALDKTGTLTKGTPSVTDVIPSGISKELLLQLSASLEAKSEHPFAKAVLAANSLSLLQTQDFQTLPGRGVSGLIDQTIYLCGNARLMEENGIEIPNFDDLAATGKTVLYFAEQSGRYLGAIAAADVLKEDSCAAVEAMKQLGLEIVMLTGDNAETASAIGKQAGIDRVFSGVLPGDKASAIKQLQVDGKRVLMVGDGINDAPALVTADVGIAIGAGTDIAIESADVVLMSDSLCNVADAIALSKATVRNIRQNLFWAFFYNCLGIPLAAGLLYPFFGIQLSPMIGAAAMSLSSVFVVTNALRLRFFRTKKDENREINPVVIKEEQFMETIIKVNGMMCPHCQARVESVCKAVSGVKDAVVDLKEKQVTIIGDADIAAVKKTILDAGYEVPGDEG